MTLPPPECKVHTPSDLAKAIVDALAPQPEDRWLDPCIGPGAFIGPLRERGVPKERIVAIDIDSAAGEEDVAATTVRGVDFFQWCPTVTQRFTKIVANPPYVAIRRLHPQLQRSLQFFRTARDSSFALRSNYWCAFLSASLGVLAHRGDLAFVLPAAWEYARYAADLRLRILQGFETVEVHRCLEPLFSGVREGCVVLIAKGYLQTPKTCLHLDHRTPGDLIAALQKRISGTTKPYGASQPTDASFTSFSELYTVRIGCVTGHADYFLMTESERIRLNLPLDAVQPVVSRARHLTSAYMTSAEWSRLMKADERVWLFSPRPNVLGRKAVQAYLEHGKKTCNLKGYKLRHRDPWYCVPDIPSDATGFLSGMAKAGPWISFRSKRDLTATNTLYVLSPKTRMRSEERAAWALSLLSTPVRRQFGQIARRYPDGLAKLEPHEVNSLRLPTPTRMRGAIEHYGRAIVYLVTAQITKAAEIADAFTGQSCA